MRDRDTAEFKGNILMYETSQKAGVGHHASLRFKSRERPVNLEMVGDEVLEINTGVVSVKESEPQSKNLHHSAPSGQ